MFSVYTHNLNIWPLDFFFTVLSFFAQMWTVAAKVSLQGDKHVQIRLNAITWIIWTCFYVSSQHFKEHEVIVIKKSQHNDTREWQNLHYVGSYDHKESKPAMSKQMNAVTRKDTFPQPIGFPDSCLPQSERAILRAAGIQLTIRTEANTVHWTKVTFIGLCRKAVTATVFKKSGKKSYFLFAIVSFS